MLRGEGGKKESVHEDESGLALTKPSFSATGLEVGEGGGAGGRGEGKEKAFGDYEVACCPLDPIVGGDSPRLRHQSPLGLTEESPRQHSHNAAPGTDSQ